jgi:large subunit ribosomal protein L27
MAKKKGTGAVRQHTTRPGKRLGIKLYGGETVKTGQVIVRQRGTKYHAGMGVKVGRDHTLYASKDGKVFFKQKLGKKVVLVT